MTIIIGIKCSNGITIACDSRTADPSGYVNDHAKKLHPIKFQDGNSAIIGEAGNAELSSRAIEMIEVLAARTVVNDYRSIATCAETAISELKQKIREQYKGTAEELQRHFEAYAFELLISHYWGGKPYIFALNFVTGIAEKKDQIYCSIGCGRILADFLISRLDLSGFTSAHGMWTSIYAIEEVKKFDGRCGGRTRSAVVTNRNGTSFAETDRDADPGMDEAIKEALEFSEDAKNEWKIVAQKRIANLVARRNQQLRTS